MVPSTLRSKRRYIVFQILARMVTERQAVQAVKQTVMDGLGEIGYSDSEFEVVLFSKGVGIARTNNDSVSRVIGALNFLDSIQGKKAGLLVIGVSGTIRKAREKFLNKRYLKEILFNIGE